MTISSINIKNYQGFTYDNMDSLSSHEFVIFQSILLSTSMVTSIEYLQLLPKVHYPLSIREAAWHYL